MRPTASLLGASRLPLTPKRGNKDYYKGTRQSYAPGGGHRTGPPGKHVIGGKSKYRLVDEQVRYFVGPGPEALNNTLLKPYVSTSRDVRIPKLSLPSFSPQPIPSNPEKPLTKADYGRFSRRYQRLSEEQRMSLIFDARKKWWAALTEQFGEHTDGASGAAGGEEEAKTKEVEQRAT